MCMCCKCQVLSMIGVYGNVIKENKCELDQNTPGGVGKREEVEPVIG